jgi:hypothetical protein
MRRAIVGVLALAGLALVLAGPAWAKKKSVHFTGKATGAQISGTEAVFKYRDSYFGAGAGVQKLKLNATLTAGTDTTTTYYGDATAGSRDTFKISKPNAQGSATFTGSGHDVSGTGKAKGLHSSYTISGTVNFKTLVFTFALKGTYNLP